jgi:hypothetical protein
MSNIHVRNTRQWAADTKTAPKNTANAFIIVPLLLTSLHVTIHTANNGGLHAEDNE